MDTDKKTTPNPEGSSDQGQSLEEALGLGLTEGEGEKEASEKVVGGSASSIATGLASLALIPTRRQKYEDLEKLISKQADAAVEKWKKEEEELRKKPSKTLAKNRPKSEKEVRNQHIERAYDSFARVSPKQAQKWANEHPKDTSIALAIGRVKLENGNLSYTEYKTLREGYIQKAGTRGVNPEEVAEMRLKASNQIDDLLVKNSPKQADKWSRENNDATLTQALNRKREIDMLRAKEEQSRISRLLGLNPAKGFGYQIPGPPKAQPQPTMHTTKPNTNITPNRLQRRGTPRSLASAASKKRKQGLAASGAKSAGKKALTTLAANPWVIVVAIIIVAIVGFIFLVWVNICQFLTLPGISAIPGVADKCRESSFNQGVPLPPEGYTVFKQGPDRINNGESIAYTIKVTYDPSKASYDPGQLTLWDTPDFNYTFDGKPTEPYQTEISASVTSIVWKLSDFFDSTKPQTQEYTFTLNVKPEVQNENVVNSAYIESPQGGKLPLRPSMDEFDRLFTVYNCTSVDQNNYNCPLANDARKKFVYDRLSDPLRSDRYKKLLTSKGKVRIYLRPPDPGNPTGITGGAKYGGDILQYWGYVENNVGDVGKWSMIHETGHIIELRNSDTVFNDFKLNVLAEQDPKCYEERSAEIGNEKTYFITYNNVNVSSSSPKSESFAEVIGANVVCDENFDCFKGGAGIGKHIKNYPNTCNSTYEWVRENIYGGVDFFGLGGSDITGDLTEGRNEPPSDRTCNGKWTMAMYGPDGKANVDDDYNTSTNLGGMVKVNFGDPVCTYSKPKWNAYLEQIETKDNLEEFWKDIAATEGTVNTGGPAGWGKFQMNVRENVFKQPQEIDASVPIRGDVTWQRQIEKAVERNNYLIKQNIAFDFWGTAYCLCYFDYYRNKNAWCGDLVKINDIRCPNYCEPNSCSGATDELGIDKNGGRQSCSSYRCQVGKTSTYKN